MLVILVTFTGFVFSYYSFSIKIEKQTFLDNVTTLVVKKKFNNGKLAEGKPCEMKLV